ncbi:hypothetical protein [Streptomyces geranii]|uniref:hypothetical protein n=1 Tax=Streptomyces geranii TaxID=2058923 RepID=UPI0013004BF7|nr:hypothetical protein [Streptomyces geranii]
MSSAVGTTSLFSAPEQLPVHERTDTPTPVLNPFQAPAFAEGTPGFDADPAEDLGAAE